MSFINRLRRLEATGEACPECRQPKGFAKPDRLYAFYPGEPVPEPPVCPSCGRSLGFVLRVVYDGEEGEGPKL